MKIKKLEVDYDERKLKINGEEVAGAIVILPGDQGYDISFLSAGMIDGEKKIKLTVTCELNNKPERASLDCRRNGYLSG